MPPIRVLVVDDSSVVRRTLKTVLSSDPGIEVLTPAIDGKEGLEFAARDKPDLVILDVDMPRMNGLEVLAELKQRNPEMPVIMFSSLVQKGSVITLDAISLGADEYYCKPSTTGAEETIELLKRELLPRVHSCVRKNMSTSGFWKVSLPPRNGPKPAPEKKVLPGVFAIGVSAGGPEALKNLFSILPPIPVPGLIVQHMPPEFTKSLAEFLGSQTRHPVVEAKHGDQLVPGKFLLAPGNFHMVVEKGTPNFVSLNQGPEENFCRPAVDPMLRSVAKIYGAASLVVILTGMGQDGLSGCKEISKLGGRIFVQDQASSVVWGMPGIVYREGLAEEALPLDALASTITAVLSGNK